MNKFWAKVKFKQEENAEQLVRAFFQEFNPESSIILRGKEAKMEIVFRELPKAIIDSINHCEVIELNYGKNLKEYEEDENLQVETEKNSKQKNAESEISEQTGLPKKKKGRPVTKKIESTEETKSEPKTINIPKLEEIAKKSNSFEHFAKLVAEWLEMDKREKLFTNLIIVSAEFDKVKWRELEEALKNKKNVSYTDWDASWVRRQVSKKLKEYSVTLLPFLNETKKYKEYSFKEVEEQSSEQEMKNPTTNIEEKSDQLDETVISKTRVKMECMPESKELEERLESVDKTQPIEKRVRYVLEAIGLNKMTVENQQQIVKIASIAVKKREMNLESIFFDANIPIENRRKVQMTFSQFINDFVERYERGKKVKLLTFLSELQNIIMFESEIETL